MRHLVGIAAVLLAVTGCSDDGDGSDGVDGADAPACSELEGETISDEFDGCVKGGKLQTVAGAYDCVDGRSLKVVRAKVGWAFVDEEFHTGSGQEALDECYGLNPDPTATPTEEPTDEPSHEPTGQPDDSLPACGGIWEVGQTLPEDYIGCVDQGKEVPAVVISCQSGPSLTAYDDRFHAFLGEEIMSSEDKEAYGDAFAECFS